MKTVLWCFAASISFVILIGIWKINGEFVADTLESTFENTPPEGWNYWRLHESWPALVFGILPAAAATIFCLVKAVLSFKQHY